MPLPWIHFRPFSMTSHFEESIIIGTRAISGSPAIRLRKRTIAASASSIPSSMLISIICAPFSTCWRAPPTSSPSFSSFFQALYLVVPSTARLLTAIQIANSPHPPSAIVPPSLLVDTDTLPPVLPLLAAPSRCLVFFFFFMRALKLKRKTGGGMGGGPPAG